MANQTLKTQVAIIGGGPAGMLLAHVLGLSGIDSIVIEARSEAYVLSRIRAGILEAGTVEFLRDVGLGTRMDAEGMVETGALIGWQGKDTHRIDLTKHLGNSMMAYGQTAITEDLYAAHRIANRPILHRVENLGLHDLTSNEPFVTARQNGRDIRIECEFIAGCDGFHGPARQAIPVKNRKEIERVYPFGWLGVMAKVPPLPELVYAQHADGFALASKRTTNLSRYYVQCPLTDRVDDWSDDRFWDALLTRLPPEQAANVVTGPTIEKSIAPLRSFVCSPMRYGNLFLAGDAAHIVPPTGAKGLNLAVSDVAYLSRALIDFYRKTSCRLLDDYSQTALKRVWSAANFSWRLTKMMHRFEGEDPFDEEIRQSDYDRILTQEPAQRMLAYEYCGVPF